MADSPVETFTIKVYETPRATGGSYFTASMVTSAGNEVAFSSGKTPTDAACNAGIQAANREYQIKSREAAERGRS